MLLYIIIFSFSTISLWMADFERTRAECRNGNRSSIAIVLVAISLLLPCILSGARDIGVGTDTRGYAIWVFQLAANSIDIGSFMAEALGGTWRMEPLYALEAFVAAKIMPTNTFLFFFIVQASIDIPVYFAIRAAANGRKTWLPMFLYYLFFYPYTLNAMRQMTAAAFLLLGIVLLLKEKKIPSLIALAIAYGFHRTALIGVIIYCIWLCIHRFRKSILSFWKILTIALVASAILYFFGESLIQLFLERSNVYASYYNARNQYGSVLYFAPIVFYGLSMLLSASDLYSLYKSREPTSLFVSLFAVISIPILLLGLVSEPFSRMMWYFFILYLVMVAIEPNDAWSINRLSLASFAQMFIGIGQFWWFYSLNGGSEIIPYTSKLLGL